MMPPILVVAAGLSSAMASTIEIFTPSLEKEGRTNISFAERRS